MDSLRPVRAETSRHMIEQRHKAFDPTDWYSVVLNCGYFWEMTNTMSEIHRIALFGTATSAYNFGQLIYEDIPPCGTVPDVSGVDSLP